MMENIEIKTPREYKIRKIERLNNRYEFFYPFLLRLFYSPMISTLYSVSKHIGNSNAVLVSAVIYFINHIVTNLIVDNKYRIITSPSKKVKEPYAIKAYWLNGSYYEEKISINEKYESLDKLLEKNITK